MTDIWFRNADRAMAVMAMEGVSRITWTRQHLGRLKFDGIAYVRQFYMHGAVRPKIMLIGVQGSSEYHIFSKLNEPLAVYPTWSGKGDTWKDLVDLIEYPHGENEALCSDQSTPSSLRPVLGQKHRIVIHNSPAPTSGTGKDFWVTVAQVQADYPHVELFINGTSSFATLFGLKFKTVDFGLSDAGDINQIFVMPNGVRVKMQEDGADKLRQFEDWVRLLGFTPDEIISNQNMRFAYRIRAAKWAAKYWSANFRFFTEHKNLVPDDVDASDDDYKPKQTNSINLRRGVFTLREADKILCNRCRIQAGCRFYRADSICGLKESEMADLEKYFDSRNASRIIDGLAHILRLQGRRAETALENEVKSGEVNPDVDRQLNSMFANGVKLAKLIDPTLAGPGTKVQVNVGTGGSIESVSMSNPKEMVAGIVSALEAQGIRREDITPQMLQGALRGMSVNAQPVAIEAQVIQYEDAIGSDPFSQLEGDAGDAAAPNDQELVKVPVNRDK